MQWDEDHPRICRGDLCRHVLSQWKGAQTWGEGGYCCILVSCNHGDGQTRSVLKPRVFTYKGAGVIMISKTNFYY